MDRDDRDARSAWLDSMTVLIDALQSLEIVARGYAAELGEVEHAAVDGAPIEELLRQNLTGFRIMLSTAIDDTEAARDASRRALVRAALAEGLSVERQSEMLTAPVEYIQRLVDETDERA